MGLNAWKFKKGHDLMREDVSWQWLDAECQVAKRVLTDVRRYMPRGTEFGPVFDDVEKCPFEIHQYQLWLREKLEKSGLAVGLAGGPAFLPDINSSLPKFWRYIIHKFRPRNHCHLARHIINNLEWYVDQQRNIRTPGLIFWEKIMPALYITGILFIAFGVSTDLFHQHWVIQLGVFTTILCGSVPLLHYLGKNTHKHRTNCAEFYRYLKIAYADTVEAADDERALEIAKGVQTIRELSPLSPLSVAIDDLSRPTPFDH